MGSTLEEARRNADGEGDREGMVDVGRPLDGVLGPSAGNHECRLVVRGGHQTGSPSSVVGIAWERKTFVTSVKKRWTIGMKNAAAISVPKPLPGES